VYEFAHAEGVVVGWLVVGVGVTVARTALAASM
jgi:hypothetical protein